MKDNNALNVGQTQAWYKGKMGFIAFALLALIIASALVDTYLYKQKPPTNNLANFADLASFTCRPFSSNQTFTIDVEVNLTDGMDLDEAIRVAAKIYEGNKLSYASRPVFVSSTAYVSEDGIWTVELYRVCSNFSYGARPPCVGTKFLRERFKATIDPFVHTVVYAHF